MVASGPGVVSHWRRGVLVLDPGLGTGPGSRAGGRLPLAGRCDRGLPLRCARVAPSTPPLLLALPGRHRCSGLLRWRGGRNPAGSWSPPEPLASLWGGGFPDRDPSWTHWVSLFIYLFIYFVYYFFFYLFIFEGWCLGLSSASCLAVLRGWGSLGAATRSLVGLTPSRVAGSMGAVCAPASSGLTSHSQ